MKIKPIVHAAKSPWKVEHDESKVEPDVAGQLNLPLAILFPPFASLCEVNAEQNEKGNGKSGYKVLFVELIVTI